MNTLHLVRSDIVDLSPQIQKVNNTSANVGQCHSLPFNLYVYRRKNANMVLKVYLNRNKSATHSRAKTLQQMCRLHFPAGWLITLLIYTKPHQCNGCFNDICNEEFKKTNSTRAACWICNERFKSKCKLKERGLYWEHWKYSKHIHHYPSTRSSHLNTFLWSILSSIWS